MLTIRELIRTLYNALNQKLKSHRGNWEQNDPTADDYIKNRPFYTDGYATVVKEKTFSTPEDYYWCSPFVFEPKEGETYIVVWDGKEYECAAFVFEGGLCIGNLSLLIGEQNTGEPFFYFYFDYGGGDIEYACVVQASGTHTVSVSKPNVVKIDKKYIPDIDVEIPETVGIKGTGENAEVFNGGRADQASGNVSHAEGEETIAAGAGSHAEGLGSEALHYATHAEGYQTVASGYVSHAEGEQTIAAGDRSHTEGMYTRTGNQQIYSQNKSNLNYSFGHAEGYSTLASGTAAHAEGQCTSASAPGAHAEGYRSQASGDYSHAEGHWTTAYGGSSHAEGYLTKAYEICSHAEGWCTVAKESRSHAEGLYTIAAKDAQHAQGKYNIEDADTSNYGKYAHIVGNGTSESARSNAHTLDWNGNAWFAGDVYVGGTSQDDGKKLVTNITNGSKHGSLMSIVSEPESDTYTIGESAFAIGHGAKASGAYSQAEGYLTVAKGQSAHAEGCRTDASSAYTHAEGFETTASASASHSEGYRSKAKGQASHSEGYYSEAQGEYSHAEGYYSQALGTCTHAQGEHTLAPYKNVFAIGKYNYVDTEEFYYKQEQQNGITSGMNAASFVYQLDGNIVLDGYTGYFTAETITGNTLRNLSVGSKFSRQQNNITQYYEVIKSAAESSDNLVYVRLIYATSPRTNLGKYAYIVGNGTSTVDRSNAHTLDWSGNAWFQGEIKIGGTNQDDANAKTLATQEYVDSSNKQSDWNQMDETAKDYIHNKPLISRTSIILVDEVNGLEYVISMRNGSLVSRCVTSEIALSVAPSKTSYFEDDIFDPTGMVVTAMCADGATVDITDNIIYSTAPLTTDMTSIQVSYVEGGRTFTINIPITVAAFDPAVVLKDFTYTDNGDGTYTITDWKQTYNGVSSTELIVPNSSRIIV